MKLLKSIAIVFLCLAKVARAQEPYAGFRTGNYTGVNGVYFNPANIADSRYRWDVCLIGINAGLGNNTASYSLPTMAKTFFNSADSLLFGNGNKLLRGFGNVDVLGPSFMFKLNKKTSFAFTTRMRTLVTIKDLDGQLLKSINDQYDDGSFPYSVASNSNQTVGVSGWSDFGLSFGRVLSDDGRHFFKAGITLKYIAGIGNSYVNINRLNGTMNKDLNGDTYLTAASGSLALGVGGINFENISGGRSYKFNGSGAGADLGFVYEYRPDQQQAGDCSASKYQYRLRVAVLDFGGIRFKADPNHTAAYSVNIGAAEKFYLKNLGGKSIPEIKAYLDGSSYFTNQGNSSGSYNITLPATIQADFDLYLKKGFYVDVAGQLVLHKSNSYKNPYYQNNVTLTPRFESRFFGVYVPLNYNTLTQFNAGLSLRAGPLFIGSGSLLSGLLGNSKQADVYLGVRFGRLCRKTKAKPAKVNEMIEQTKTAIMPKDIDGDGITDDEDHCPTIKGVPRFQGCPIPDTDGDGVNDEEDRCQSLPGTAANDGCPSVKQELVLKVNRAAKAIQFQTGDAVLLKSADVFLNIVAEVMIQDVNLKLSIEGHTDNVGDDETNQILSQKRAYAVLLYLKAQGVSENRLDVKGFGETMPLANNKTAAGRAMNRRVELKVNY